jgi:hypothetical protein
MPFMMIFRIRLDIPFSLESAQNIKQNEIFAFRDMFN